jgi:flagellar biosynthesis protein FlhG
MSLGGVNEGDADTCRKRSRIRARGNADPPLRVVAVASGKGGVGKTNSGTANLAVALKAGGQRVCVLDADLGLANLDVVFGLTPEWSLLHVLRGERSLAEVMVDGPAGVRVIPAASGFEELTALTPADRMRLLDEVDSLDGSLDVLLVDSAAGISTNVLYFSAAATDTLVVITPEPTALTDAYALIKLLASRYGRHEFLVMVNMAAGSGDAEAAFQRLARVAERFLRVRLGYLGYVPYDDEALGSPLQAGPAGGAGVAGDLALARLAERVGACPPSAPTGGCSSSCIAR